MYECICGFSAATASDMHHHISTITANADGSVRGEHRLKTTLLRRIRRTAAPPPPPPPPVAQVDPTPGNDWANGNSQGGTCGGVSDATCAATRRGGAGGGAAAHPTAPHAEPRASPAKSAALSPSFRDCVTSLGDDNNTTTPTLSAQAQARAVLQLAAGTPITSAAVAAGGAAASVRMQHQRRGGSSAPDVGGDTATLRLGGSVVAAIGGWLAGDTVGVAAAAATAAAAAAVSAGTVLDSGSGSAGSNAAARKRPSNASEGGSRWSLGGLLRGGGIGGGSSGVTPLSLTPTGHLFESGHQGGRQARERVASAWWDAGSDEDGGDASECSEWSDDADGCSNKSRLQQQQQQPQQQLAADADDGGGTASFVVVQKPAVQKRAAALRALLLWRSPAASARMLGLGMYSVLLLGYVPHALHYMQLTTLLPAAALCCLTYNVTKPLVVRLYARAAGQCSVQLARRLAALEVHAGVRSVALVATAAAEAGMWALGALWLTRRALRGRRFTTTAWTVLSLWLLLLLSELRVMSQTLLAMVAYGGLFVVPLLYSRFKTSIDAIVCDGAQLLALLFLHAERWAYALALAAAGLTWQLLDSDNCSVVVQSSAAAGAALGVLVWRVAAAEC